MPIHDWTRVDAGIFNDFHLGWTVELSRVLNNGVLPDTRYAMIEPWIGPSEPDLLAAEASGECESDGDRSARAKGICGLSAAAVPPQVEIEEIVPASSMYCLGQRRVVIRRAVDDGIAALLEIIIPGNRDGPVAVRQLTNKTLSALRDGHHLIVIDLFPPGPHDLRTLHGAIWSDLGGAAYAPPPGRPLTLAAYRAADGVTAYVEPTAAGRELIDMPLFFDPDHYVNVPLAATYAAAYEGVPRRWRRVIEGAAA